MAHNEKRAGSDGVYLGVDWNYTSSATTLKIAPTVWRWDAQNTNNSGGRFWEALYPEPDGSTGGWTGLAWGSGSGWRKVDTFATRTYTRTHDAKTITLDVGTDASFGTYYGSSFITIGSLTRSWTLTVDPLASYSVTYKNNGGGTAPSAQTKWYGEELALRGAITNRTNYVFKNWNTKSDGTGTAYAAGAKYTGNAALTLYAQWYAPYTITPNANGGTLNSGCSALTKVYNTAKTIWASSLNPTRTGYTFTGWNTKADGTGTSYAAGANYTANASTTLYAQWKINTWTVTYDGNGATGGSTSSQTKTYNQALTLRSNGFTRTNYNFVKWNTAANGSGNDYVAGGTLPANVNNAVKLYAQWVVAHANPTIQSITVKRCDADGTDNVEGTRMHVMAAWKVDNTTDGFTDTTGSTFKVTLDGTTDTVNLSGTSGTVDFVHSATAAIGSSYTVTSVLADSKGFETTRTSTLSVAYFTMHFKAGGTGVGIGKPSTEDNLLDVGMPIRLNTNSSTNNAFIRVQSANRSADAIRFYGAPDGNGDAIVVGDGGMTVIGAGESPTAWYDRILGTDDPYCKSYLPGSEHLFLTSDNNVWLVSNANAVANRKLARVETNGHFQLVETTADISSATNGVSAATYRIIGTLDSASRYASFLQTAFRTDGMTDLTIAARNFGTGANVDNSLVLKVANDGTRTVAVSVPAAWRNALGASSGTWPQSIGGTGRAQTTANRTYWCGRILYDNNTGTSGTVTLAETAANFTFMFIGIRSDASQYTGLFVRSPNGKKVGLACVEAASNYNYIKTRLVTISGTSISGTTATHTGLSGSAAVTSSANEVYITHVIGFS